MALKKPVKAATILRNCMASSKYGGYKYLSGKYKTFVGKIVHR